MNKIQQWTIFLGRMLLGLSFIGSGLAKAILWHETLTTLSSTSIVDSFGKEMVPVFLILTIFAETVGGLFVTLGYKTRAAAFWLVLVELFILFFVLHFLEFGPAFIRTYFDYLLHVKVLGGLFLLLAFGPGKFSIDKS